MMQGNQQDLVTEGACARNHDSTARLPSTTKNSRGKESFSLGHSFLWRHCTI